MTAIPLGYCQCGCGNKTKMVKMTNAKRGVVAGEPRRFLAGHNRRVDRLPLDVGRRFGRLVILGQPGSDKRGHRLYDVVCDCGLKITVAGRLLVSGTTRSCGCLRSEMKSSQWTTHGQSRSSTYRTWKSLIGRTTNPNHHAWRNYGGRGISVCERWRSSFEAFFEDMGERPEWANGGIDRINNEGDYEPGNCRWATRKQQANNRRPRKIQGSDGLPARSVSVMSVG